MTPESFLALSSSNLIPENYAQQAKQVRKSREEKIRHFFQQRKLPVEGWSETEISCLLDDLSQMDSNNFPSNCGVGEREGRIYSGLVRRRHFGLAHGVGRSGDLREVQPKAAGSSVLNKVTNAIILDLFHQLGLRSCQEAFLVPVATGMAITLILLALRKKRTKAKYVLWSRIDQKSCFKSISCAGFEAVVIELLPDGDELQTDVEQLERKIESFSDPDEIAAVISTTSCFAPRACDDLSSVAKICKSKNIPHVINNAYGIQSSKCLHLIEEAGKIGGEFSTFVQSCDKNFMVPVGGAIIAGFDKKWIESISQSYPGRASASPSIDVFITLMSMGLNGYKQLMKERKENFVILKDEMMKIAAKYGERVLESRNNPISIALTLEKVPDAVGDGKAVSEIGSMLFTRGVSGTRAITGKDVKTIEGHQFKSWGCHSSELNVPYLTAAAAIGMTRNDIELFIKRLDKVLSSKISTEN